MVEIHHFDRDNKIIPSFFIRNFLENIDDIRLFVFVDIVLFDLVDFTVELNLVPFRSELVTLLCRFCRRR